MLYYFNAEEGPYLRPHCRASEHTWRWWPGGGGGGVRLQEISLKCAAMVSVVCEKVDGYCINFTTDAPPAV